MKRCTHGRVLRVRVPVNDADDSLEGGAAGSHVVGFHVAPAGNPSAAIHIVDNFFGPAMTALLLIALWGAARPSTLADALVANILIVCFFIAIEGAYAILERIAHVDADVLLLPEVNYGAWLLIVLAVAASASGGRKIKAISTRGRQSDVEGLEAQGLDDEEVGRPDRIGVAGEDVSLEAVAPARAP